MILRRGMGAFVPIGSPYFRGQGPLLPTVIGTIAGRQIEGPRGLAGILRRGMRGLGDVTYCASNPPSADQVAYLSKSGISYSIVPCGGTPTPQGAGGIQPISTIVNANVAPGAAPVYQAPTDIEDCAALGLATSAGQACVARNTARAVAAENLHLTQGAQYQTQLCIANGGAGWVPAGQDVGAWCAGNYGGVVPSGYSPIVSSGASGVPAAAGGGSTSTSSGGGAARLSFQNLTSGNISQLNVGDKWVISISGAPANARVNVSGGQNGANAFNVMGSTDSAGNFSKTGTITADQVGTWQETWTTGDPSQGPVQAAGFVAFTVLSPSTVPVVTPPLVTAPKTTTGGGGATTTSPGTFDLGGFLTESVLLGIPNWIWLVAVGGGFMLFEAHKR